MNWNPPAPDEQELQTLFPLNQSPPPEGVFELGLVLGGTVSTGAYMAGVLDFLVEALNQWDLALQAGDPLAPNSRVVLKAVGGASGGGVNAAILSKCVHCNFPPIQEATCSTNTGNPFFDIWVNQLDIAPMLETGDLASGGAVESILNGAVLDRAAYSLSQYGTSSSDFIELQFQGRRWLDETLTLFMTLTNLKGVPYKIQFQGMSSHPTLSAIQSLRQSADFVRFEMDCRAGVTQPLRPDSFGLSHWRREEGFVDESLLNEFAMATSAFPMGFPVRRISRPLVHYAYRAAPIIGLEGQAEVRWLKPDWDALCYELGNMSSTCSFPFVDGGATNNSPLELVHSALAGMTGRNYRDGQSASRALILIDPFADSAVTRRSDGAGILSEIPGFLASLLSQCRYSTADLMLAADEYVFSRFMVTGRRGEICGGAALASAGLGGFMGFLSRDFRQHDFLLGRCNAHEFLATHFVFPDGNPVFSTWTVQQRKVHSVEDSGARFLRMIPLLGTAAYPPMAPSWPAGKLKAESFRAPIENRLDDLAKAFERGVPGGPIQEILFWLLHRKMAAKLTSRILALIKDSLMDSKLNG